MNIGRIREAAADPRGAAYRLRGRWNTQGLFARYGRLARRAGVDRLWLILSFDCDTPRDAEVAWGVHARLLELGVTPVYAVPGDILRESAGVYARIAATGAEFINHGDRMHAYYDSSAGRWSSSFFYDCEDRDVVRADVTNADATLREVLGTRPAGFRTPHFGTFQAPEQLRWLHRLLGELGYRYSTSTMPLWGFRAGPVFRHFGCHELPVTGGVSSPFSALDTWSCFEAPDRVRTPAEYEREAIAVTSALAREGAGVLNVYADPSHVHDREEFFRSVERWLQVASPASYTELLDALG